MTKPGTAQLQLWMKEVITCQGVMKHKLARAAYLYNLHERDVVAETRDVSIYSRINVYTSGYVMRLLECLRADFPVLQKFVGEEVFTTFAEASLMWSPSTSYSLYNLGNTFIRFLEATRPKDASIPFEQSIFLDLPMEITRAERARQEALRARGIEGNGKKGSDISPEDILFCAHLITVETPPCLRLLELKFPVKQLFDQLENEQEYETPALQQTFMAVSRMNYRPVMEEIEEWQYRFLQVCHTPETLTEAINETAAITNIPSSRLIAELCLWLSLFEERGFVVLAKATPSQTS